MSQSRYVTSTRSAACTGPDRSWKNATSSTDDIPTVSQPMNSSSRLPASTSSCIPAPKHSISKKKRINPASRCRYRLENRAVVSSSTATSSDTAADSRSNRNTSGKLTSAAWYQSPSR